MSIRIDPEEIETQHLHDYAGGFGGKRVLEIGAGNGRLTWRYAHDAAHVTALEPDAEAVAEASDDLPEALRERVWFLPVSLEGYDLSPAAPPFDVVILSWSL